MKTFNEWLKLQEGKFNRYPSAFGGDNMDRLAKERAGGGKKLTSAPHGNYIYCKSCGNQFVNKTNEDPDYFVCNDCDNARKNDDDDE
jgi:hypothetical protein